MFKRFVMSEGHQDHLRSFLSKVKRSFKFMNNTTARTSGLVSDCLDYIGYKVSVAGDDETRAKRQIRRARLVPAIFKLITLALIEERAYIVRCVKSRMSRK